MLHDGDGDDGDRYLHVFVFIHGSVEVKVFDVTGHEFCIGCGKDTVEHDFYCCEVCCLGADIAIISDAVTIHGESHMTWVAFFWVIGSDNVKVCCLFVLGDGCNWDKKHGISASRHVSAMSLAEAASFIGTSINPELALTAGAQLMILSNQPGVGVKCIAMQCLVGIERDAFAGNQCFLGCCSNVMEFGVGACGMHMGW